MGQWNHHIFDPGGGGMLLSEVECGWQPIFTNRQAEDDDFPPTTPITHLLKQLQQFTLVYLFINLVILAITITIAMTTPNFSTNIKHKQHCNPIKLKFGNVFSFFISKLVGILLFIIFNKLMRENPEIVAQIFGIILCLYGLGGVSLYNNSLRPLFSYVRCCQLGGGSICGTEFNKCIISIDFMVEDGVHFLIHDLILTISNIIISFSSLSILNPVCGSANFMYQRLFLSVRVCTYCILRILRLLLIVDTEFVCDICLFCFNFFCDVYFLPIMWYIFVYFFIIQCNISEPITWSWFRIWNILRGDR